MVEKQHAIKRVDPVFHNCSVDSPRKSHDHGPQEPNPSWSWSEHGEKNSRPKIESSAIDSHLEEQSFLNRPITHAPPPLNLLKSPRVLTALYEK